jgi:arginine repressor
MVGLDEDIERAVATPDCVVESVSDTETRLDYRYLAQTLVGLKYSCVVVKVLPGEAFVITAYLTDNVKEGRVLWPTAV